MGVRPCVPPQPRNHNHIRKKNLLSRLCGGVMLPLFPEQATAAAAAAAAAATLCQTDSSRAQSLPLLVLLVLLLVLSQIPSVDAFLRCGTAVIRVSSPRGETGFSKITNQFCKHTNDIRIGLFSGRCWGWYSSSHTNDTQMPSYVCIRGVVCETSLSCIPTSEQQCEPRHTRIRIASQFTESKNESYQVHHHR